jgi:hypothetical protein
MQTQSLVKDHCRCCWNLAVGGRPQQQLHPSAVAAAQVLQSVAAW